MAKEKVIFVGSHISPEVATTIRAEAKKESRSLSAQVARILAEWVERQKGAAQ